MYTDHIKNRLFAAQKLTYEFLLYGTRAKFECDGDAAGGYHAEGKPGGLLIAIYTLTPQAGGELDGQQDASDQLHRHAWHGRQQEHRYSDQKLEHYHDCQILFGQHIAQCTQQHTDPLANTHVNNELNHPPVRHPDHHLSQVE